MSEEFDAALASVPGAEEDGDPASMETFSDFVDGFGSAGEPDEAMADEDDDPAADVKAMQQALVNERVAHMDLLPHRCAHLVLDSPSAPAMLLSRWCIWLRADST